MDGTETQSCLQKPEEGEAVHTLTIMGGGSGAPELLTGEAAEAIRSHNRIYAAPRLAEGLSGLNRRIMSASWSQITAALEGEDADTAVIVSGDTGFFSLAAGLCGRFGQRYDIQLLPGISSMQLICARMQVDYRSLKVVSTHGRRAAVCGPVSYHDRVLILTGGEADTLSVLRELRDSGLEDVAVTAGERLGGPGERIRCGTPAELAGESFSDLCVLLVHNHRPAARTTRLRDDAFIRGGVPMTKEAVRTLVTDRLEIEPGHTVYDIGAGTGSVSVAMARRASDGMVYAVERGGEGAELIRRNRQAFGTHNIAVIEGSAPEALDSLPPPDRVFVGGSSGNLKEILRVLREKSDDFVLCLTAVTLESLSGGVTALEEEGFLDLSIETVNVAVSRPAGRYHMMQAENPITIITGRWKQWNRHR